MPLCPEDMRVYTKTRRVRQRNKAIEYLGGECVKCGDTFELEFDHIDPRTKKHEISDIRGHGWNNLLEEVKKCQLLCKSCHKHKTIRNRDWEAA